jgi:DNA-binding transcriptional MerR regulator
MTTTRDDVLELLGDVDDLLVERVIDTGASIDEIGEALDSLEDESRGLELHLDSSPRVTEVRAILAELVEADEDEERATA